MRDEGFIDLPGEEERENGFDERLAADDEDEPWRESLTDETGEGDEFDSFVDEQHPLQQRAFELMGRLHELFRDTDDSASHQVQVLLGGTGDMMGGLAQALGRFGDDDDEFSMDPIHRGLGVAQLKRALRGAAFASGSLFALAQEGIVGDRTFNEIREAIETLRNDIFGKLQQFRGGAME